MERSLDSLRRAIKTEALAHRRDLAKMMRESVMLTKVRNFTPFLILIFILIFIPVFILFLISILIFLRS